MCRAGYHSLGINNPDGCLRKTTLYSVTAQAPADMGGDWLAWDGMRSVSALLSPSYAIVQLLSVFQVLAWRGRNAEVLLGGSSQQVVLSVFYDLWLCWKSSNW